MSQAYQQLELADDVKKYVVINTHRAFYAYQVDGTARHGLSCKWREGRHQRHAAVNDIIHHSMAATHLTSRLEPTGLSRSNAKCPNGVTLVPWRSGRLLVWDATCPDTFAPSHQVPPEWQPWLSGASRRSMHPSTNATTSHQWPLRRQALLGQRLSRS